MKRSVRLAAKAHNVAIVVLLICAAGLAIVAVAGAIAPTSERATNALAGLFAAMLGIALAVMLATGFHIAVTEALQRMERRDKDEDPQERL